MTRRSELRHRILETREIVMTWVAGKVFTFRQTGLDGWIKRRLAPAKQAGKAAASPAKGFEEKHQAH